MNLNLEHRCPICGILVVKPAAMHAGDWYCRRHVEYVPPAVDVLGIREAVSDCVGCPYFTYCREWIDDVCFG